MKITRADLDQAARDGIIATEQVTPLWEALSRHRAADAAESRFDVPNVAYYLGAVLVIVAMFLFMTLAWREYGGGSLLVLALVYGVCFTAAGGRFWRRDDTRVAGGLLLTLAVFMVPLAILGVQFMAGLWPEGLRQSAPGPTLNRLVIEAATLASGLAMARFVRFSFLAVPIVAAAWLISVDLVGYILGPDGDTGTIQQSVAVVFGLATLAVSWILDHRTREDFSFWGYLGGLLSFWVGFAGLTLFNGDAGDVVQFLFALVGVASIGLSVLFARPIFVIFGSLAVLAWLFHVAYGLFEDSLMFPVVLSLIGIAVLWLGVRYHRSRARIEAWLTARIPDSWRRLIPPAREG
ncbi:MAG: DUF2157 domain-containing protein [Alphaproteobacteria bacterium]|nr:DUF2157 domain-containing protein [Alphaproteobacteria bacterium]